MKSFDSVSTTITTPENLDEIQPAWNFRPVRVGYVGVSNWAAWQIAKALGISAHLGLSRFTSLQAYYSVAGRDLEREIVPPARKRRSWGPFSR
jgi:hypothetical protein